MCALENLQPTWCVGHLQALCHNSQPGKGCISMNQEAHDLASACVLDAALLCPHHSQNNRINGFQVAGVGRNGHPDLTWTSLTLQDRRGCELECRWGLRKMRRSLALQGMNGLSGCACSRTIVPPGRARWGLSNVEHSLLQGMWVSELRAVVVFSCMVQRTNQTTSSRLLLQASTGGFDCETTFPCRV